MTRWIENVSRDDVRHGWHTEMGINSMLIQIGDPANIFPKPEKHFKEVHQFEFLDAEDGDNFDDDAKISDEQAQQLVRLLQRARDNSMNVLVHCHAGICRSGAVVEVGTILGFTPTERFRLPNLRVKHKMMKALGLTYDANEKSEAVNGTTTASGLILPNWK